MATYWNWTKTGGDTSANNPGGQVYDTYRPYKAKSGACERQENTKLSEASTWGTAKGVDVMKAKLAEGPLSIALVAGSKCWQWYKSGVLDAATARDLGC